MDQEEYLLNIMTNFKTTKAGRELNASGFNIFDDSLNSFGYLSEDDKRRCPFVTPHPEGGPFTLAYSQFMADIDPNGCLNDFEYLFHPLNYKVQACVSPKCEWSFCPYYHSPTEKDLAHKMTHSLKRVDVFTELMVEIGHLKTSSDCLLAVSGEEDAAVKDDKEPKSPPKARVGSFHMVAPVEDEKEATLNKTPYNRYGKPAYHSKKAKKGNLQVNEKSATKYYYGQEVSMFEDINHEFKNFSQLEVISL